MSSRYTPNTLVSISLSGSTAEISFTLDASPPVPWASEEEIEKIVDTAIENGINFFDMASSEAKPFAAYGRAIKSRRDKVYFQIHFGANYETGAYGWTTNLDTVKRSVDWQMKALQNVEINIIHAKIFKALIQVIFNVLLPADPGINFLLCTRGKLCGNHIFITLCKIPERFPNKLLTGSIPIGNRRIIKIDAKLQTMLYNFPCPAFCMLRRSAGSSIQCINPKSI